MPKTTKQIGDEGEQKAVKILEKSDYVIIECNFRTRFGEIDIIAKDGRTLVFIEVKAKKDDQFGTPAEMVTAKKLDKIKRTAIFYISENKIEDDWRIDVVAIEGEKHEIIKNVSQ